MCSGDFHSVSNKCIVREEEPRSSSANLRYDMLKIIHEGQKSGGSVVNEMLSEASTCFQDLHYFTLNCNENDGQHHRLSLHN